MFICDNCGSSNVQMQMWVYPNTNEIVDDVSESLKDNWCDDCEDNVTLTTVADNQVLAKA